MSSYVKGRQAENYVARRLRERGARLVVRSSRSLTPADLIAFFPDRREVWLVQVKAKKGVKAPRGYEEAGGLEGSYKVRFVFALRGKARWLLKGKGFEEVL